jgi:hypothetical protein
VLPCRDPRSTDVDSWCSRLGSGSDVPEFQAEIRAAIHAGIVRVLPMPGDPSRVRIVLSTPDVATLPMSRESQSQPHPAGSESTARSQSSFAAF